MSIAEATLRRELSARVDVLVTRVDSLERENTDLKRRMDELSKAHRLLLDQVESKGKKAA